MEHTTTHLFVVMLAVMVVCGCAGEGNVDDPIMLDLEANGYAFCDECWVDEGGGELLPDRGTTTTAPDLL